LENQNLWVFSKKNSLSPNLKDHTKTGMNMQNDSIFDLIRYSKQIKFSLNIISKHLSGFFWGKTLMWYNQKRFFTRRLLRTSLSFVFGYYRGKTLYRDISDFVVDSIIRLTPDICEHFCEIPDINDFYEFPEKLTIHHLSQPGFLISLNPYPSTNGF